MFLSAALHCRSQSSSHHMVHLSDCSQTEKMVFTLDKVKVGETPDQTIIVCPPPPAFPAFLHRPSVSTQPRKHVAALLRVHVFPRETQVAFPTEGRTMTLRQRLESKKWLLWLNGNCFTITSAKACKSRDEILIVTVAHLCTSLLLLPSVLLFQ